MYIAFNVKQIKSNEMFHINNTFFRQNGHEMIDPGHLTIAIGLTQMSIEFYLHIHLHCSSAYQSNTIT